MARHVVWARRVRVLVLGPRHRAHDVAGELSAGIREMLDCLAKPPFELPFGTLELLGHWRRRSLEKRLALLRKHAPSDVIVAVARGLLADEKELERELPVEVVLFSEVLSVREVLATEMLEALGVYTSKSLSLFETGEALERGDEPSPTRSSVLVRLSHGHVRFGTFERLATLGHLRALGELCAFVRAQYFPEIEDGPAAIPRVFAAVCRKSAALCASWAAAGFVHGVLNTDNLNVTGESFDYGPWRFLPHFDPLFTAAYFDHSKLYAAGRQLEAVRWNLERLAEALAPVAEKRSLDRALDGLEASYLAELAPRVLWRLGVAPRDRVSDSLLASRAFCFLQGSRLPFEHLFFDWYGGELSAPRAFASPHAALYEGERFAAFRRALDDRPPARPEALSNPYFHGPGPTTMHVDEVERVWADIAERDDWRAFDAKITEVRALGERLGAPG